MAFLLRDGRLRTLRTDSLHGLIWLSISDDRTEIGLSVKTCDRQEIESMNSEKFAIEIPMLGGDLEKADSV